MAMATMKFASVKGLSDSWLVDREVCARVDEGGRIIRSQGPLDFVGGSEANCLENAALLRPYMERQREALDLDVPDIESLKQELVALHTARSSMRVRGTRKPKALMEATVELIQANVHLDAKAFKRLLSYARHRFLRGKDARES